MVDPTPHVSIVIPTSDGEEFLLQAVESALQQTYENFEVIAIDDGSRDRSGEILASIVDPRLKVISLDHASGHSARPRNIAGAAAKGTLIAPLDHDDLSHPERVARQVERFVEEPNLVLLGTQGVRIDEANVEVGPWSMPTGEDTVLRALRWRCPFIHSAVMYRKDAFDEAGGYDERAVMAQDHALWLRLAALGTVDNLPDTLCSYRIHTTQITQTRLMAAGDKAAIAEARLALAEGRGESAQMAALRQRVWVWRHAIRAFRRVLGS